MRLKLSNKTDGTAVQKLSDSFRPIIKQAETHLQNISKKYSPYSRQFQKAQIGYCAAIELYQGLCGSEDPIFREVRRG